jgi:hypothetical protein
MSELWHRRVNAALWKSIWPPAVLLGLECLSINVGCLAGFRQSVVDNNQTSYRFAIVLQYARAMDQFSV